MADRKAVSLFKKSDVKHDLGQWKIRTAEKDLGYVDSHIFYHRGGFDRMISEQRMVVVAKASKPKEVSLFIIADWHGLLGEQIGAA